MPVGGIRSLPPLPSEFVLIYMQPGRLAARNFGSHSSGKLAVSFGQVAQALQII